MSGIDDRGVVLVSGADAATFLQGLLTNDVLSLAQGEARYAALLSPQGKILFDFLVVAQAHGFALDCPATQAAALATRLGFYKLRAKVAIQNASADLTVNVDVPEGAGACRDPRAGGMGWRKIVPLAEAQTEASRATHDARRIALGVPAGGRDFATGETFPHEANLDRLHGIDFKKGCYVGQEVVSRVEHRGLARKRIVRLSYDGAAPRQGAELRAGGTALGVMGSSAAGRGLALVRLDRAEEAGGVAEVEGVGVKMEIGAAISANWA